MIPQQSAMSRSRIIIAALATAAMAVALTVGSVSAAANSKSTYRDCPPAFNPGLVSVDDFSSVAFLDHNNDGWLCADFKPLPEQSGQGDNNVIDNTAR
jgi:hypothetical protein